MAKPPATRKPTSPLANIPAVDPALYANLPRYAGSVVMTVFEQIGGVRTMSEWAEENKTDFYTKLFPKLISTPKDVNVSGKVSIEEAVRILDLEENKDYNVIEDAQIELAPTGQEPTEEEPE